MGRPWAWMLFDFLEDGGEFFAPGLVNRVVGVLARDGSVGGNDEDAELVNVEKFGRLGFRRAGHAGQFLVKTEIILNGDGGERLGFALDLDAFLGFHGLMQAVAPSPAGHEAAGVLVHDDDLVFLDHVFHVELVKAVGLEQLGDGVDFLRLGLKILLDLCFRLQALAGVGFRPGVNFVQRRGQVRQHKRLGILRADEIAALFGQVSLVAFFVDGKKQFLLLLSKVQPSSGPCAIPARPGSSA